MNTAHSQNTFWVKFRVAENETFGCHTDVSRLHIAVHNPPGSATLDEGGRVMIAIEHLEDILRDPRRYRGRQPLSVCQFGDVLSFHILHDYVELAGHLAELVDLRNAPVQCAELPLEFSSETLRFYDLWLSASAPRSISFNATRPPLAGSSASNTRPIPPAGSLRSSVKRPAVWALIVSLL